MPLVLHAAVDSPGEKGHGAAGVGDEDLEARMAVEDAGEEHAREGDGDFHGEAEGEWEHVTVFVGSWAVDGGWEAVMRMEEDEGLSLFECCPYRVEVGIIETIA